MPNSVSKMTFNQTKAKCTMQFTKFTSNIIDNAIFDIQTEENLQLPSPRTSHLLNLRKQQYQIQGSHSGVAKV